ncbi:hypothetical protein QOZ80_1AG0046970 [Eleusine coracana subsp. coracana]|nr:hypothetical protein QOZ80_1AG0046970 [Eleusine coracana subsp. coracana]
MSSVSIRLSVRLVVLSIFWTAASAVRSSTLHLARSPGSVSPDAGGPPVTTWAATLAAQFAADAARLAMLTSSGPVIVQNAKKRRHRSFVPIAPGRQILSIPNYIARARLGTPPQTLLVAIDPSNDAAWFPCTGCTGCATASSLASLFSPTQSSTYRPVRCGSPQCSQVPSPSCPGGVGSSCAFNLSYAGSTFQALLGQDTVALENGNDMVASSYTFGCLHHVVITSSGSFMPPQGLIGFGRGPLSFMSQTKDVFGSVFSYCLPSYKSSNFSGTLRLGPTGQPRRIKTTPLLRNPHRPSLYYVDLVGVRVGGRNVPLPPSALAANGGGGGGTIVDAGTMFTRLAAPVYAAVRDAFRRRVRAPVAAPLGGFDTCYSYNVTTAVSVVPTVTFVFAGPVAVTLPEENVMIHSSAGGIACLAMAAGPVDGVNAGLNVLASMQQQNHRVLFDVGNGRVGFSRERCTA